MADVIAFTREPGLTLRQREMLRTYLAVCADMAYDDIEENGAAPVDNHSTAVAGHQWALFDYLPECTYTQTAQWRRDMARSFDDLAGDFDTGSLPRPRTMAEQLALLTTIRIASSIFADGELPDDVAALPAHPGDHDWETATDALTDDRDADAYYEPSTARAWLAIHPIETWFTPHDGAAPRDPDRGYRR